MPEDSADYGYAPPPPTRREPSPARIPVGQTRTTSAYAERTSMTTTTRPARSHHLRLRGENDDLCVYGDPQHAPPPPTRRER